jgi:hypothetical protein
MTPKQRLKCQFDFVDFFYDVFDRMEDLWIESIRHDDVSVGATDIAEV